MTSAIVAELAASASGRFSSGWRRQTTTLSENSTIANSARRSPSSVGSPSEPLTTNAMPASTPTIATTTRRSVRSRSTTWASTAAKIGVDATMTTTFDTAVWVTAPVNAIWLTLAVRATAISGSGDRRAAIRSGSVVVIAATTSSANVEDTPKMKAIVQASKSAARMNSESVDTISMPNAASAQPRRRSSITVPVWHRRRGRAWW